MKICPVCYIEYLDTVEFCKKCDARLVSKDSAPVIVVCSHCNGTGKCGCPVCGESPGIFWHLFTFGLSAVIGLKDPGICKVCGGSGKVKLK